MTIDRYGYISSSNTAFMEDLYQKFQENPQLVDREWQKFFEGYEFSARTSNGNGTGQTISDKEVAVVKLIQAYRARGHLIARTNPVRERRSHKSDLELEYFGLSDDDLNQSFEAGGDIGLGKASLADILAHLRTTYCRSIGVEFIYNRNENLRRWMYNYMEPHANLPNFDHDKKKLILDKIMQAVQFESFLQTKYVGKKRFSLEGLESLIPSLDAAIHQGASLGAKEFVFGMAHRGRLNVLVNIFGKAPKAVFSEFNEAPPPEGVTWSGDVKYHLGRSADIVTRDGHEVHLSLLANPSHLEAVNPVVQGATYAKLHSRYNGDLKAIIPVLIHGDAAMAGQGINYEMANMYDLPGYRVGGTVHIILNNQIGFTADYKEGRSSMYCTDIAKVTESPVFHVNADDPEAVVYAVEMAVKVRQLFNVDVFVDILGYRRYGHNEGDEPRFTQPVLYDSISKHPNVYEVYKAKCLETSVLTSDEVANKEQSHKERLQLDLDESKTIKHHSDFEAFQKKWTPYRDAVAADFDQSVDTGVDRKVLDQVAQVLYEEPAQFNLFSKMKKILAARKELYQGGLVDWALAEQLAYGSLLLNGHGVRISGQDSQRGTFAHRHAVIKDEVTAEPYQPLSQLKGDNLGFFSVYNSFLSEYCVLGFEHGYAMATPNELTIWEAQFGDFSNGAQIMIDQFISCTQVKWQRSSGLVLYLPHGYEGQGPEHSSARLERYLQLCAHHNMFVVNPTTCANLFHLIRRQIQSEFRIPLVVMTPKSLLRSPVMHSKVSELESGRFQELIDDGRVSFSDAKQMILCSGKVYYDLLERARELGDKQTAIIRIEQLYPLPKVALEKLRQQYRSVKQYSWVQEEPENMGAWSHILRHLPDWTFRPVARPENASPAVGNAKVHAQELESLLTRAFKV